MFFVLSKVIYPQLFFQKVFAEVQEDIHSGGGGNLLTSQVDWPSEDDDYNPEKFKQIRSAKEDRLTGNDNSDSELNSDSSSDSDSNSTGSSEVEFFDEFVGKSRKRRPHFEEDESELSGEDIISRKRQHPDLDYKKLYDVRSQPQSISFFLLSNSDSSF